MQTNMSPLYAESLSTEESTSTSGPLPHIVVESVVREWAPPRGLNESCYRGAADGGPGSFFFTAVPHPRHLRRPTVWSAAQLRITRRRNAAMHRLCCCTGILVRSYRMGDISPSLAEPPLRSTPFVPCPGETSHTILREFGSRPSRYKFRCSLGLPFPIH